MKLFKLLAISALSAVMVSCGGKKELNGHEYVDLGLASGTMWATTNLGAEKPGQSGDYFAWAENYSKASFSWETYKYGEDESALSAFNATDSLKTLKDNSDAATTAWGKGWSTPTKEQFQELIDKCTWEWDKQDGLHGYKITGPSGKSIFLPAAGYYHKTTHKAESEEGGYWTGNLCDEGYTNAYGLAFDQEDKDLESYERCFGQSIRPVCNGVAE